MINVDKKIENIYYMLCYTFYGEKLKEKEQQKLGTEAFENIYNLFSLLLCLMLRKQIKKGIHKDYNSQCDELSTVKGKININNTINHNSMLKKKLFCEYDEFSENCLLNQIIKTTIFYLIKSNKIGNKTKKELKKIYLYFNNVDIIEIKTIKWDTLRFNRNNKTYKYIVDLCNLVLNGLIVSSKKGEKYFREYLDDRQASTIYENFLKAFFRKHYPEFHAKSKYLYLNNDSRFEEFIPVMKTDVTLEYNNNMLIIDAKFYSNILDTSPFNEDKKIIKSENIYQIMAYVDNQEKEISGSVYGMLLYAQTLEEPEIKLKQNMNGHKIMIQTLDMNNDWEFIEETLVNIAESFKNNSF